MPHWYLYHIGICARHRPLKGTVSCRSRKRSKTHHFLPLWEPTTRQLPSNTHAGHQFPSKTHPPPTLAPKPRIPSGKKCEICSDIEVLVARIWPFRAISKTLHGKKTSQTDRNRTKLFPRVACMYADVFRPKTFLCTPQKTIGVTYAIAPKNVKSNQLTGGFFNFQEFITRRRLLEIQF